MSNDDRAAGFIRHVIEVGRDILESTGADLNRGHPIRTNEEGLDMPNQPRDDNPARAIRVPDKLWAASKKRAEEKGETVSEAVRKFLERYSR